MKCCADGCDRDADYKAKQLCQKHYFRLWRNGTTELVRRAKPRIVTPNGYVRVHCQGHPLANRNYVFEHRKIMYEIVGEECCPCQVCGKPQTWETCHVDHIDENRKNNAPGNLRVLCRGCNVKRGFKPESYESRSNTGLIEFEGRKDTAHGWARDPRVKVSGSTIHHRKARGMSDYDALFARKKTHNGGGS